MAKQIMFDRIADCGIPGGDWGNMKTTPQAPRAAVVMPGGVIKIVGATDGKIYTSNNYGGNWSAGVTISAGGQIRGLLYTKEGVLLATDYLNNKIFRSLDAGKTWDAGTATDTSPGEMVELPDGGLLLLCSGALKIYRSDDQGKTWEQWSTIPLAFRRMILTNDNVLLTTNLSNGRVYRSFDLGLTWDAGILVAGTETSGFFGIAQVPTGEIYVCSFGSSGRVYQSSDTGRTWKWCGVVTGTGLGPIINSPGEQRLYCFNSSGNMYRSRYTDLFSMLCQTFKKGTLTNSLTSGKIFNAMTGELLDQLIDFYVPTIRTFPAYNIRPGETWYRANSFYGLRNSKTGKIYNFRNGGGFTEYLLWMDETGFYVQRHYFNDVPSHTDLVKIFYDDFSEVTLYSLPGTTWSDYYSDNNGTFFALLTSNTDIVDIFSVKNNSVVYNTAIQQQWFNSYTASRILSAWDNGSWGYTMICTAAPTFDAVTGILGAEGLFTTPTKILARNGEYFDIVTPRYSQFGTPREDLSVSIGFILDDGLPVIFVYDPNSTSGYYSIYAPKNRYAGFGYMLELFLQNKSQDNLINFHRPVSTVLGKFKS